MASAYVISKAVASLIHMVPLSVTQVGKSRLYTPSHDDVGSVLKVEVVVIDASRGVKREAGHTFSVSTTRVKVRSCRMHTLAKRAKLSVRTSGPYLL